MFCYKITLKGGAVIIAEDGVWLDRLIRDRVEAVASIEVVMGEYEDLNKLRQFVPPLA